MKTISQAEIHDYKRNILNVHGNKLLTTVLNSDI